MAELLKKTSLILYDEAPMANKICFEALDRTLRDILRHKSVNSSDRPFGGMTMVLGGGLPSDPSLLYQREEYTT